MQFKLDGVGMIDVPDDVTEEELQQIANAEYERWHAQQKIPVDQLRKDLGAGQTLQLNLSPAEGTTDTGIPLPQGVTEFLAGAGRRAADIATLGNAERDPTTDRALNDSGYATAGGIAADVGAMAAGGTALKAASAIPGLGSLATAAQALQAPKSVAQAVTAGGLYGASTTQGSATDRAMAGLGGVAGGGLGYGASRAIGGALAPEISPEARDLLKQNVKLTIGETMGGWVKRLEDGATSILGVGDMIRKAKGVSLADFNRAVMDEVVSPLGLKLADTMPLGNVAYETVDDLISKQYHAILPQLTAKADLKFFQEVGKIKQMMRGGLPRGTAQQFDDLLKTHVYRIFKNPTQTAPGQSIKEVDSLLGQMSRGLRKQNNPYDQQQLGNAIIEVQKSIRGLLARTNPDASSALRRVDAAYARKLVLENAMNSTATQARGGLITPADLMRGVKSMARKNSFAKGRALLQKTAQNAAKVIPSVTNNSGTADRTLITGMILAPGYITGLASAPGTAATVLGGMAAYTQPGQALLRTLAASRTPGMLNAGKYITQNIAPMTGVLGTGYGLNAPR